MRVRPHVVLLWVLAGVLALLGVMLAVPAYAAVVGEWRVNVLRGTTTVYTATGTTQQLAWEAGEQYIGRQAPGTATYTLQTPRYVARVVADPSVCTISQPPAETQPGQCPAGTVGNWDQSRSYITAPYPTCWSAGPWVPAEPPNGACTEPVPPPTGDWTHCANQEQRCEFSGTRRVRYGVDTRWIEREFTGGVMCNSTAFGGNPASGALKTCQLQGTATPPPTEPPPPTGTGTALLNWRHPSQNIDDTPLGGIVATRVYYGRDQANLDRSAQVDGAATTYTVTGLPSGTWFFQVSTVSQSGESAQSNVATKVVP